MSFLPSRTRVFLCLAPTDMRKSFDKLAALVAEVMKCDPLSRDLFVFRNRAEDRMKILFWDRSGFCLYYKRLEKGRFSFPTFASASGVEIDHAELLLILEGIELDGAKRARRFCLPKP
jgi:transposase